MRDPRKADEVVVTYTGDAEDRMSVSLKFIRPRLTDWSTVVLVDDVKTDPRLQDAAEILRDIVETGLIRDEDNDDDAVRDLWNALISTR